MDPIAALARMKMSVTFVAFNWQKFIFAPRIGEKRRWQFELINGTVGYVIPAAPPICCEPQSERPRRIVYMQLQLETMTGTIF